MFRFNNWTPNTCNDLPECGQECHDLNVCSDNSTYIDRSGITRYIFATYDSDWNLTCMSGISCDQEVYDKPPKYNRHYAPCCWTVSVVGGSGIGTCGQSCEKNYSYTTRPSYLVDVSDDNTYADVYIRHSFYGYGTGRCNTPLDLDYLMYSSTGLIGRISDLNCGLEGSGLFYEINNFIPNSSAPLLCNYNDMVVTYSGSYTRQECVGNLFVSINTDLDWTSCLDVSTVIESGYPGCYTQDGEFISLGDPYNNSYQISMYEAISFSLDNFVVSGVTGYDDDIALASALKTTCNECQTINRTWGLGQWDGRIPYNPKAICCNCPETDMCLNSWSLDLSQPSAIITLNSYAHGDTAKWLAMFPDSGCIIDSSGGTWGFEYLWQAEPGSGDLPLDSGFWNRCDFSQSSIELNYTGNFTPAPSNSGTDCKEQIVEQPNGYCHICADRNGPDEFLVTIDIDFKKNPVYKINITSFDPPRYFSSDICDDGTKVEVFQETQGDLVGYLDYGCAGPQTYRYNYYSDYLGMSPGKCHSTFQYGNRNSCLPGATDLGGNVYTDNVCYGPYCIRDLISVDPCLCGPSQLNGSWILSKAKSQCRSEITIREDGSNCDCEPCSSGTIGYNICRWVVNDVCGLNQPSIPYAGGYNIDGHCPCGWSSVIDATGEGIIRPNSLEGAICAGCPSGETVTVFQGPSQSFGDLPRNQCWNSSYSNTPAADLNCPCCVPGPTVGLYQTEVSGVPKLSVVASVSWYSSFYGIFTTSASTLIDAPVIGVSGSPGCFGDPYMPQDPFNSIFDCNVPISFVGNVPSGSWCNGGTITVEKL